MTDQEKDLSFCGSSRKDIRAFPDSARKQAGLELYSVQMGDMPSDWKPMSSVGSGVKEIRIHEENEYRVLYIAKFKEAIYVLHAFEKKSYQTPDHEIDLAKRRLKDLKQWRKQESFA